MKIDLHVHTKYSDGGLSLTELFKKLKENNICLVSITDHNSIDAYDELDKINTYGIQIVNGVEIDVQFEDNVVHILLYNFDKDNKDVKKFFNKIRKSDIKQFEQMLTELHKKFGIKFSKQQIKVFENNNQYFDRVRLNNFLTEQGVVETPRDAFMQYTKHINDKVRLSIASNKFFKFKNKIGATSVLAHPMKYIKYYGNLNGVKAAILKLKQLGLDGIEVYNNRQTIEEEQELLNFTKAQNMLISGGSDFHAKIGDVEKKKLGCTLNKPLDIKMVSKFF